MDATLTYGMPRVNQSGTLLEGIALWGELKPTLTRKRLPKARWRIATGRWHAGCWRSARTSTLATRSLLAVEALLTVKQQVAPYLDLQLVAFPQDGVLRSPAALSTT